MKNKESITFENGKMSILVNSLLGKIQELQSEISELRKVTVDEKYSDFNQVREDAMIEALKANGVNFTYKRGDIVSVYKTLYVVNYKHSNSEVYCFAALFDFSCDNEHTYCIEVGNGITFNENDPVRPASDYEIVLFDYELSKKGYKRDKNGNVVKL